MKILQSLLLLIGALAVLALGTVGASASPAAAPCHETSQTMPGEAPSHVPKAMKAMICCVACVATPTLDPAPLSGLKVSPARLAAVLIDMPAGRLLSPEPGPPRLLIV
ncbi:hypothetical protein [Brevundimonas sp. G8]|uniref:hypothetical protein n=1 Tax=Brevundimonas sp. G8 TaxID=1350776 RepID=UPI0012F0F2E6|nr:hypothetical protein [Brevundimonas sp. G8]VXB50743.1 conserved exported hypothetical protein [Brevundimonas sp. G8]